MLVEKQAVCPYCGKQRFVNVENSVSEEELNQMAGETCDCDAAKRARGMKQTDVALDALLGPESCEKGFDYEVDEDTVRELRRLCQAILSGLMDRVTLTEPNGDTIKLVRNGCAVKVERICKKQVAM